MAWRPAGTIVGHGLPRGPLAHGDPLGRPLLPQPPQELLPAKQGDLHRLHLPDVLAVIPDRAIGGEPAAAGDVEDGHARPVS